MFRVLIVAAVFYGYGHPAFDHYRPAVLDKPLQNLYTEVNSGAQDGRHALGALVDSRTMRYLGDIMARVGTQLQQIL